MMTSQGAVNNNQQLESLLKKTDSSLYNDYKKSYLVALAVQRLYATVKQIVRDKATSGNPASLDDFPIIELPEFLDSGKRGFEFHPDVPKEILHSLSHERTKVRNGDLDHDLIRTLKLASEDRLTMACTAVVDAYMQHEEPGRISKIDGHFTQLSRLVQYLSVNKVMRAMAEEAITQIQPGAEIKR
ncbi:MAG: hypothetical protein ACKVOE_03680 [Rickettsiales bacterium]